MREEDPLFARLPVSTKREIAGNPVSAAAVSGYLLEHAGDAVAFIRDASGHRPFASGSLDGLRGHAEAADAAVDALIANGILAEGERIVVDDGEPDTCLRALSDIGMQDDTRKSP